MCTVRYVAVTVTFFATACFVCAIGFAVAPPTFLGSVTNKSEVPATSHAPTEHGSVTLPSSPLLGSKPKLLAQGSRDAADRNGDWVEVVDAVNMRSGAASVNSVVKVQLDGTQLRVLSRDGNWIHVMEPESGLQGWVYKKYVQLAEPAF